MKISVSPAWMVPAVMALAGGMAISAQAAAVVANSPDGLWSVLPAVPAAAQQGSEFVRPRAFVPLSLNYAGMRQLLATAPMEFTPAARDAAIVLHLPMPDGSFARFKMAETITMEEPLRQAFPQIRSYSGVGLDDRTASVRVDVSEHGFRAMIVAEGGSVYIDPYTLGNTDVYTSYRKSDAGVPGRFACGVDAPVAQRGPARPPLDLEGDNYGTQLRQYRTAVAATGAFTAATGGTVATGLSAVNNLVNRMSQTYERDLAVRFVLVANNNLIIYTNSATDPYDDANAGGMLGQNNTTLSGVIGNANFDIGHVVGFGSSNGVASLGSVCTTSKAQGVSISDSAQTVFLPFTIDYVAHEVGHQFAGNHTMNNCGSGPAAAKVEPGSGITIMGYAGICGATNIASNSIDGFHAYNLLNEMRPFTTTGSGGTCGSIVVTNNTIPTVNGGPDFAIPVRTPYVLTATGSDANGDPLLFAWEQIDARGTATALQTDPGSGPITRSYALTSSPTRWFPQLPVAFVNSITNLGETLPTTTRTITHIVSARDGRGGYISDTVVLSSTTGAGPFTVTAPGSGQTWTGNSNRTVTWNVANTTAAPISCANVRIAYTTNGGNTWIDLIASTPNDGSEVIVAPNIATTTLRIGVFAVGNVFWNVNTANVTVTPVVVQPCYANCDESSDLPVLGAADFSCFLNKYRAGDAYANCDGSTDAPVLGASDFSCFLNKYRAGCP